MGILFTRIWRLFNHQGERRAGPGPLARAVGAGQGRARRLLRAGRLYGALGRAPALPAEGAAPLGSP